MEVDDRDNPDPNNAFGGQTADGDYMTTVANITVRINTERMSDYIATFGTRNVNDPENNVDTILKGILKEAFEQCLANWPTEKVMANKPTISAEACAIAIARIETEHPLIVSNLNYPDIQASDEYEAAIKQIADARMLEQLAKARKTQNEAEAEANNAKAIGEATVIKTNADAAKYQQEIAAEATANATRTAAQAEADALLLLANAEAEASGKLGTLYAEYPGLLEVKRLEAYQAIGANWNGQYIPSIGGGDSGLNILNIGDILGTLLRPQESATPVATVEAPPAAE